MKPIFKPILVMMGVVLCSFSFTNVYAQVHFSYDPITHYVSLTERPREQPEAVTIVGSFQSELGCPGDWLPGCDKTSMEYNELYGIWTDTLDIPAGHWEYKITINNSWNENYGLYKQADGLNIPLDLCYPSRVVFIYHILGCFPSIYSQVITNGVCVNTFYDANASGSF